nr:transporter substrate-binding domain-containing protein [Selenomonadaceae bacterium]MBR3748040.1 transporter substrate-binding domain-containing protein [Selenomonadaceae bacterium]
MKKIFALLMTFALIFATGCGSQSGENKTSDDNKELKLGTIKYMNVTEMLLDTYFEKASSRMDQTSSMRAPKHVFFDNMTSMLAGLQAGQIDAFSTYECVGNYLVSQNSAVELVAKGVPDISDSFCCAMLEENSALKKEFDDAILKLTADGTLKKLAETFITNANFNDLPSIDMPKIDGAPTIKVAVTGDLPPLDFVRADGQPAGFNTAVLAAISQQIGKNFELVNIDSGARAAALTSKQVDVVFWVAVPLDGTIVPADFDKPAGMIVTEPYFTDKIVHVQTKK